MLRSLWNSSAGGSPLRLPAGGAQRSLGSLPGRRSGPTTMKPRIDFSWSLEDHEKIRTREASENLQLIFGAAHLKPRIDAPCHFITTDHTRSGPSTMWRQISACCYWIVIFLWCRVAIIVTIVSAILLSLCFKPPRILIYLSIYLSIYISIYLYLYLYIYLSIYLSIYIYI